MKYMKTYLIITALVISSALVGYFLYNSRQPEITGCTMEAKLCPDGAYVGRTGPNCEFSDCPAVELSGIKGIAMLGPMCPVMKDPPEEGCDDRPYKTDLVATSPDGTQIFRQFSSGDDGKFSVELEPGEYAISSADTAGIFSHCSRQGAIKVEKNKYTEVIISCDTGIR